MTKRYDLLKNQCEVKKVYEGCTFYAECNDPELIASYESWEEAKAALAKKPTTWYKLENSGMTFYNVSEYHIEEIEVDEDGEEEYTGNAECGIIEDISFEDFKLEAERTEESEGFSIYISGDIMFTAEYPEGTKLSEILPAAYAAYAKGHESYIHK